MQIVAIQYFNISWNGGAIHTHTHTHTQSREIPNVVMGIYYYIYTPLGLPGGSDGKESTCSAGDLGLILGWEDSPGAENGNPLEYFCLDNPHGERNLAGYSPWGCKESDTTEQLSTVQYTPLSFPGGTSGKESTCQCKRHKRHRFNPWVRKILLEEGMATHSSILASEIPCTEEPGGLQSIVSQSWTWLKQLTMHART